MHTRIWLAGIATLGVAIAALSGRSGGGDPWLPPEFTPIGRVPSPTRPDPAPASAAIETLAGATRRVQEPGGDKPAEVRAHGAAFESAHAAGAGDPRALARVARENPNPAIRTQALMVLSSLGQEADVRTLEDAIANSASDPGIRLVAIRALAAIATLDARGALERAYDARPGDPQRYHILNALGEIADPASIEILARALRNDADPAVRAHAATALARVATPQARQALLDARADAHPAVHGAVERALASVTNE